MHNYAYEISKLFESNEHEYLDLKKISYVFLVFNRVVSVYYSH